MITMMKNIVVGLDGSPFAEAVLPYVSGLAKGLGAEVTLVSVTHLPDELSDEGYRTSIQQVLDAAEIRATDYLNGVAKRLQDAGVHTNFGTAVGDAPDEIVNYADRSGADLIALSTH